MNMNTVSVAISGISPLLMHRFPAEPIEALEKKTPHEQASLCLYEFEGKPFIPGENLQRALVSAAAYSKGKGRASLVKVAAAALFVNEQRLLVRPNEWTVDARPVVVPATRGRVLRYRPRFEEWGVEFTLSYDATLLTALAVRQVVDNCGQRVGLLDFRPECKGSFGRFAVTRWET